MDDVDPGRLRALRRAKRLALLAALAGAAGAVTLGLLAGNAPSPPSQPPPGALDPPVVGPSPLGSPPRTRPAPRPEERPVARGPVRRVPLRVLSEGEPARGVFVRAIRHDPAASTATEVSGAARTDAAGLATIEVEEPVAPDAWLEMALADESGARHGFLPLANVLGSGVDPATVSLPQGGSLRIEVRGLPEGVRARRAQVHLQAPYGDYLSLFRDAKVLAATDGGPTERGALPSMFRVPLDERGDGTLAHVPDTFAVAVFVDGVPDGYIVEEVRCTAPAVPSTEGSVVRVAEGSRCTYTLRWKALPAATVRVTDEAGKPVAGARVAVGTAVAGARARLSPEVVTTDAEGRASVALWGGSHLPEWTPDGFVVVASAPGRLAQVVPIAGGRWYGVDATVALSPSPGGRFRVLGTLRFPGGGVAAGIPVTLAAPEPWDAARAVGAPSVVTGAEGAFAFEISEDLRPVFAFGGGLRLQVDGDRLEGGPAQAAWRTKWPTLPRATTTPATFDLPPVGGAAAVDLTLSLPE